MLNTSDDRFIRTTDPDHEIQSQKIFRKLYEQYCEEFAFLS